MGKREPETAEEERLASTVDKQSEKERLPSTLPEQSDVDETISVAERSKVADLVRRLPPCPEPSRGQLNKAGQPQGEKIPSKSEGQRGPATKLRSRDDAIALVEDVRKYFEDIDEPAKYFRFREIFFHDKKNANGVFGCPSFIAQVKQLFRDHKQMLRRLNEVLLPHERIVIEEDVPDIREAELHIREAELHIREAELHIEEAEPHIEEGEPHMEEGEPRIKEEELDIEGLYLAKVKSRSLEMYKTFLSLISSHLEGTLELQQLDLNVQRLFADDGDLMVEYAIFQPYVPSTALSIPKSKLQKERKRVHGQSRRRSSKRKHEEEGEGPATRASTRANTRASTGVAVDENVQRKKALTCTASNVVTVKRVSFHSDCKSSRTRHAKCGEAVNRKTSKTNDVSQLELSTALQDLPVVSTSDTKKGVWQLDLSEAMQSCTSYRLLPEEHGHLRATPESRSKLFESVLNNDWVSTSSASSRKRARNWHEETLIEVEDEQSITQVELEVTKSTRDYIKTLLKKQVKVRPPVENFLSPLHLGSIKKVYGSDKSFVAKAKAYIELLNENPTKALPKILALLIAKVKELKKFKKKNLPLWSKALKDHLHKSLHHQRPNPDKQIKNFKRKIPKSETNIQATEASTPPVETTALTVENRALTIDNRAPKIEESAPTVKNIAPIIKNSALIIKDSALTIENSALIIEDSAPIVKDSAPFVENSTPIIEGSAPTLETDGTEPRSNEAHAEKLGIECSDT